MSIDPDRFNQRVVDTLFRRSACECSNPDCHATTSGPADQEDRSISVGEAAHIYGAKPGATRYDPGMAAAERSAITNAIWLCRNCHKIVDADPIQFPAALLFEWRDDHEKQVTERIGKTSDRLRRKVIDDELEGLHGLSYLARQIVIDKPDGWEYRLTAELLRSKLAPVLSRWRALERGHYAKPYKQISKSLVFDWFSLRMTEINGYVRALTGIINYELPDAWGPEGQSGSPASILRACSLLEEACQQLLSWEEEVRFLDVPNQIEEFQGALPGVAGRSIEQVGALPGEFAKIFADEELEGTHSIKIVLDLPDGWEERCHKALEAIHGRMRRRDW